jgi:two-component system, OmpR family, osmolarity sensor histidine kinase EnvZ
LNWRKQSPNDTVAADLTGPAPLETVSATLDNGPVRGIRIRLSLFWRTFFLIAILLFGSILAWLQTLRALEFEPRAIQTAQQIASLVNLSRAGLIHTDAIARTSLLKTMTEQERVRIVPREPTDHYDPFDDDALSKRISAELRNRLGPGTIVADSVNNMSGLWVGFDIDGDNYWMLTDHARFKQTVSKTWLIWLISAAALSLAGAALLARLINRPLKELSFAASRVREGDFVASRLDEHATTNEIRQVNIGFNRMAQRLAKIEQDRAIMLAGISHDLRTPLARLRLETEMSVSDAEARDHMATDIEQLDAIIDKFMDYARPDHVKLGPVNLKEVVHNCLYAFKDRPDMHFNLDMPGEIIVQADEVELGRVFSNLFENARRYGKSPDFGMTIVDIAARTREKWILIRVRDYGPGVDPEILINLTKPFFRGDTARTAATGAGLGLSIVEKTLQRMGGKLTLSNSSSGGLSARIQLPIAKT